MRLSSVNRIWFQSVDSELHGLIPRNSFCKLLFNSRCWSKQPANRQVHSQFQKTLGNSRSTQRFLQDINDLRVLLSFNLLFGLSNFCIWHGCFLKRNQGWNWGRQRTILYRFPLTKSHIIWCGVVVFLLDTAAQYLLNRLFKKTLSRFWLVTASGQDSSFDRLV